jgi:hypothetical protein
MTKPPAATPIAGLDEARFECVFPTCGGICCKQGRPPVEPAEARRIQANLDRILPLLRPEARARIERDGFLTNRVKEGNRSLGVVDGWCVFHNDGCVLHKLGASEGDWKKYKPWHCVVFPLERSPRGGWHVRQWGVRGEAWDLFCLNPAESPKTAGATLRGEIEFAHELDHGSERWRFEP